MAIPAFDYKYNEDHGDAVLLGVAGTDVPLESIAKLAQPHQVSNRIPRSILKKNVIRTSENQSFHRHYFCLMLGNTTHKWH